MKTIDSEAYRIAEEAHKGVSDSYVKELCAQAAREFKISAKAMYARARAMYDQHFA